MPREGPLQCLLELAKLLIERELPTAVIVGSAIIERVTQSDNSYEWHLARVCA